MHNCFTKTNCMANFFWVISNIYLAIIPLTETKKIQSILCNLLPDFHKVKYGSLRSGTWTRWSRSSYKIPKIQDSKLSTAEDFSGFLVPWVASCASLSRYDSWEYSSSIIEVSSTINGSNKWAWTPRFKIKSKARALEANLGEQSISCK